MHTLIDALAVAVLGRTLRTSICSRIAVFHPDIVRRVAEDCVPAVTKKLAIPLLRPQLEPVLLHLVYANQDR